jgi:hypothetical protein
MLTLGSFLEVLGAALLAATGAVGIFHLLLRLEARRIQSAKVHPASQTVKPGVSLER